tara:strand:- start:404 stop:847 length:444 start_codon:yes stop_codon:yes gene_type:complete
MGHTERFAQKEGARLGVRARNREPEGGAEITFQQDPSDAFEPVKIVNDEGMKRMIHSKVMDYKTFSDKCDDVLRELVLSMLEMSDATARVEREIQRRVEVACKASQGSIDLLVKAEIERQVKAAAVMLVAEVTFDISINGRGRREAE